MRSRLLPHPALSVAVFLLWLLLNNGLSWASSLLGLILAILLPLFCKRFWPDPPRTIRIGSACKLFVIVLHDIVVASLQVARIIVTPKADINPAFIEVPLELRDPFVATILASIVSLTPGTVSVDVDQQRWVLHVHALNVDDRDELVAAIKQRYEKGLQETFKC